MNTRARHAMPFGATLLASQRTRFRLWAPSQAAVAVDTDRAGRVAMQACGDGWYQADADCGAGTRYRFELADGALVPDPASRAQHGDADGPSLVVDPEAYAWRHADWRGRPWHETVCYELHVGLVGGFDAVIGQLDRLAALGVTAIELMPVAEFPGARNWGYDGVLPFAPEASYGSPQALKRLVDAAHERGLMLFVDVVYNHFGPRQNWLGRYAQAFFRDDVPTPWGAAIDFRHSQVAEFFIHNALYWVEEFRVDGLRLDAVQAIVDDDFLQALAARVRAGAGDRAVHLIVENDNNDAELLEHGFDAQWNDDFHHSLHVLLTGEAHGYYADYQVEPTAKLARALAEGFVYQGQPSGFRDGHAHGSPSAQLSPLAFVNCLQNHDQIGNRAFGERLSTLIAPPTLHAAMALLLLAPSVPLLFMGEEWDAPQAFLYFTDYDADFAAVVHAGRRREFATFPGFADAARRAAIPDPNDPATFHRSRPSAGAGSTDAAERMARLLAVRQHELVPRLAGVRSLGAEVLAEAAVRARWRLGDGAIYTLWCNLGETAVALDPAMAESASGAARALLDWQIEAWRALRAGSLAPSTTIAVVDAPQSP